MRKCAVRAVFILAMAYLGHASAASKDRDWKLGRVLDSTSSKTTFETGASSNTTTTGTATANTTGTATSAGGTTISGTGELTEERRKQLDGIVVQTDAQGASTSRSKLSSTTSSESTQSPAHETPKDSLVGGHADFAAALWICAVLLDSALGLPRV
jgi:hypothetical protein